MAPPAAAAAATAPTPAAVAAAGLPQLLSELATPTDATEPSCTSSDAADAAALRPSRWLACVAVATATPAQPAACVAAAAASGSAGSSMGVAAPDPGALPGRSALTKPTDRVESSAARPEPISTLSDGAGAPRGDGSPLPVRGNGRAPGSPARAGAGACAPAGGRSPAAACTLIRFGSRLVLLAAVPAEARWSGHAGCSTPVGCGEVPCVGAADMLVDARSSCIACGTAALAGLLATSTRSQRLAACTCSSLLRAGPARAGIPRWGALSPPLPPLPPPPRGSCCSASRTLGGPCCRMHRAAPAAPRRPAVLPTLLRVLASAPAPPQAPPPSSRSLPRAPGSLAPCCRAPWALPLPLLLGLSSSVSPLLPRRLPCRGSVSLPQSERRASPPAAATAAAGRQPWSWATSHGTTPCLVGDPTTSGPDNSCCSAAAARAPPALGDGGGACCSSDAWDARSAVAGRRTPRRRCGEGGPAEPPPVATPAAGLPPLATAAVLLLPAPLPASLLCLPELRMRAPTSCTSEAIFCSSSNTWRLSSCGARGHGACSVVSQGASDDSDSGVRLRRSSPAECGRPRCVPLQRSHLVCRRQSPRVCDGRCVLRAVRRLQSLPASKQRTARVPHALSGARAAVWRSATAGHARGCRGSPLQRVSPRAACSQACDGPAADSDLSRTCRKPTSRGQSGLRGSAQ